MRESSVVRTRNGVVILRRRGALLAGFAAIVAIGSMGAIGIPMGIGKNPLAETLLLMSFVLAAMRIVWRAMVRPKIEMREEFLTVYGFFDRHILPIQKIDRVEVDDGLVIAMTDGECIPVFAFSESLLDRGGTVEAAAREVNRLIGGCQAQGEANEIRKVAFDWTWMDLALVPVIFLLVENLVIGR